MGSINYLHAIKPDIAYLKKIIENSLLSDWVIRIEYQSDKPDTDCWQLWGKAFFAIRSAEVVLARLLDCHTKNPESSIRLSAEKFRPQSRVLYTVYNPRLLPPETDFKTQTSAGQRLREHDYPAVQTGIRT